MKRLAASVLCAATVACGSSEPNPSPASPPSAPKDTLVVLAGRVTDAATGLPIAGALVDATNEQKMSGSGTSDSSGAYRIAGLRIAGYTVTVRRTGYDSVFRGLGLNEDTSADFQLTPLMTTLAGTWVGFMDRSPTTGPRQTVTILNAPLTQAGASFSSIVQSPPSVARFSGTLQDPSAIGAITGISGTLTLMESIPIFRGGIPCQGTAAFTGTANWTSMLMTTQQITLDCGSSSITYTNVVLGLNKLQ